MTRLQQALSSALLATVSAAMLAQATPGATHQIKPASKRVPAADHAETPEHAFQSNCSRCHYAPESLSPRITGTVVRHMRIRANLSAEEERLILSYLNP